MNYSLMKGFINFESVRRRSLKSVGLYYKWLFYKERKNPTDAMLKMRELYSNFVKENSLCFDIGANMGSRVACFIMLKAKVLAVEPQEVCMKELRKNFRDWPVTLEKKGVGSEKGMLEFHIADNSLISSFSQDWIDVMKNKHKKNNWSKCEMVEITTLDLLIEKYGLPAFIKIDTEGYEYEVLKGLTQPVKNLSFEYTLPDPKLKILACISRIEKIYSEKIKFNISIEESYILKFSEWKTGSQIKELLTNSDFNIEQYGGYGDIYVRSDE